MHEQEIINLLERIYREVVQINKNLGVLIAKTNAPSITYTWEGQSLTSSEAVNEELHKCLLQR